jgi:hypothetical protein
VLSEVMEHYGLALPFDEVGFFTTEPGPTHEISRLKAALKRGHVSIAMGEAEAKLPTYSA